MLSLPFFPFFLLFILYSEFSSFFLLLFRGFSFIFCFFIPNCLLTRFGSFISLCRLLQLFHLFFVCAFFCCCYPRKENKAQKKWMLISLFCYSCKARLVFFLLLFYIETTINCTATPHLGLETEGIFFLFLSFLSSFFSFFLSHWRESQDFG